MELIFKQISETQEFSIGLKWKWKNKWYGKYIILPTLDKQEQRIISMMCISLAVFLVPALGLANLGIGFILLGIKLWKESE